MIRTQIQLTEQQAAALKKLGPRINLSMAELIRQGIDLLLNSRAMISQKDRRQRALKVSGKFHSGHHDLSENHDVHLAKDFKS